MNFTFTPGNVATGANIGKAAAKSVDDVRTTSCGHIYVYSNAKVTASRNASNSGAQVLGTGYSYYGAYRNVNVYRYNGVTLNLSNGGGRNSDGTITNENSTIYRGSIDTSEDLSTQKIDVVGYLITTDTYTQTTKETYNYTHLSRNEDVTRNIYNSTATNVYSMYESMTTSTTTVTGRAPYHALAIQSGDKAGQYLRLHLEDMHTDTLGLTGISVSTRDNANSALSAIDGAIDYALDQSTTLGAVINRLQYTEENLVTASENTQASESVIRDADMAKAMMDYARVNVLQQAAQTMLAQANQNVGNVMNLLT